MVRVLSIVGGIAAILEKYAGFRVAIQPVVDGTGMLGGRVVGPTLAPWPARISAMVKLSKISAPGRARPVGGRVVILIH
jgi:hypothetical protein